VGLGDSGAARALDAAYAAAPSAWMADSTRAQLETLQGLIRDSPMKYLEGGIA